MKSMNTKNLAHKAKLTFFSSYYSAETEKVKSGEKIFLQLMSGSCHIQRVEIVIELGIFVFF